MYKLLTSYSTALVTLMALDGIWIGLIAKGFYKQHIGFLFRETPIWPAIIAFYVLYAAALMFFVVTPTAGSIPKAALWGGTFRTHRIHDV